MTAKCRKWSTALLFAATLFGLSQISFGVAAQNGAAFFRGKIVRIIVGYAPGGGYDSYARMLAPHLASRLGATVIVENEPGGGGFNALNNLMGAPADGSRILLLNGEAAVLTALVNPSGVRFDLRKLAYLGRVSYETRTLVARKATPYEHIDGFLHSTKPVYFGAGGRIDSMGDPASILCDALGIACRLITGFQGATDAALALQRGEVDAIVTSESQTAHLIASGPLVAVAILSPNKAPLLPGVSSIFSLIRLSPEKAKWLLFRARIADFGRTLAVPDDTPADRLDVLQEAVTLVLTDRDVLDEGRRTDRPIAYATGAESRRTLDSILTGLDAQERTAIRALLLTAY
jgi:tripartite-type tricarboxylate transporter receptor subunit TctC